MRARAILNGSECVSPASVYDALSARVAALAGFRLGLVEGTVARAKACAQAGADAIFVVEFDDVAVIEAVRAAVDLPLIIGSGHASTDRKRLQALGGRILLQGHQPVAAAVKALRETYEHLHRGGVPAALASGIATHEEVDRVTIRDMYSRHQRDFLRE